MSSMAFMTIANMSLMAVPLIAVVVLFRFFTVYKLPKKTFYAMWGIVSAQLLIPYNMFARFDISAYAVGLFDKLKALFVRADEIADTISSAESPMLADTVNTLAEYDLSAFYDIFYAVDRFVNRIDTMSTANTDIVTAAAESSSGFDLHISPILLIWLTGLICFSAYFIVTHMKSRRIYDEALPIDSIFIRAWKVEYSDSMRRKVKIRQSDMITSPLTYGVVNPVILLPCDTDYRDETTLKYILYHEYTHIWRFDTLSKLILTAALCIHWFNPFVWIMYILANRDIELSCDENVVRNITTGANAKSDYAVTLIKLAEKKRVLALSVSFSRNIMRERIKSIMKTKKRSLPRVIAAVILVSMLVTMVAALQSCDSATDADDYTPETNEDGIEIIQLDENFVMQEPTDKLVVYMTIDNERFLTPAINIFKEKYPEIEVEIVEFASEVISSGNSTLTTTPDDFRIRLNTELAAGQGPDLILADTNDFSDIYKTMATEIFADLNQFIENDSEFNIDEYNKTVLDSGVYQGKRYIMPYDYYVPVLVTTEEILDAEGINPDDLSTFDGFIKIAEKYNEKYKDNTKKSLFRNWGNNSSNLNNIFSVCGIDLVNYQTNKPGIDKGKFKNIMDIIKKMYVGEEGKIASDNMMEFEGLKYQNWLFRLERYGNNISPTYQLHDWLVADNLTPVYFKYPDIDNGVTAEVRFFAGIRKTSKNQISAYNLLKIILSEEIQSEIMYIFGNPVLKSAVRVRADKSMSVTQLSHLKDDKIIENYLNILINTDSCKIMPKATREFLLEEMTPYFEDKRSFDDCYDRLVNKLELYISE